MSDASAAKPQTPLFFRILVRVWLVIQGLLLFAIIATHGAGMDPDYRLLSGAAMIFASFPLSVLAMYVSVMSLDALSLNGVLFGSLVAWGTCFLAGAAELWLISVLIKRLRVPSGK